MFQADGAKFANAQKIYQNAYDSLHKCKTSASQVSGSCPSDFEGKGELDEACNLINTATVSVIQVSQIINQLKESLMSLDSAFQYSYMQASSSFLSGDAFGNQAVSSNSILEYSTEEYYEMLFQYLDTKGTRTAEEEQVYQDLLAIKNKQEEWEKYVKAVREAARKQSEEEYKQMSGLEKFWTNTKTFTFSLLEGMAYTGGSLIDGAAMYVGAVGSLGLEIFGRDAQAKKFERTVSNFVEKEYTADAYDYVVDKTGLNKYSAYGKYHTLGMATGQVLGYSLMSAVPGGPAVTGTLGALSATGSASQRALQNGATFDEALATGTIAGIAGGMVGAEVGELKSLAGGAATFGEVAKYTTGGAFVSMAEPFVNTTSEYLIYANDGTPTLEEFGEYYVESGGLQSTLMAGAAGGLSIGVTGLKSETYHARNTAIDNFKSDEWISENVSKSSFNEKLKKADSAAKKYQSDGVMDRKTFYEVWGAEEKPDVSTYLSKDYIDSHIAKAYESGLSRFTSIEQYDQYVVQKMTENNNQKIVGNPKNYSTSNTKFNNGSEFMTTKSSAEEITQRAMNSDNPSKSLAKDLSMQDPKIFDNGVVRYDIDSSELGSLNVRMANGMEPGAYKMDWIPGGYTLDGSYECVVDKFSLNDSTKKVTKLY